MKNVDLVIIGGGAAGMAAAIKAKENGINSILILERNDYLGGVLNQCIHSGFGLTEFKEELTGPEYADRFIKKINALKIEYKLSTKVYKVTKDKLVYFSNKKDGKEIIKAKAIIFAVGCYEKTEAKINLVGSRPSGIITAGLAQRYLNIHGYLPGKRIVIIGSGDIGLIMARRLTLEGAKVISVNEINPYCAGLARNVQQCLIDYSIPLNLSKTVKEVIGKGRLKKVVLAKVDENFHFIPGSEEEVECDTLLLSVGLSPYLALLEDIDVKMSSITSGPLINETYETSVPGIFICGNSLHIHDVVDFVSDEARQVAMYACKYINNDINNNPLVQVKYSQEIRYVIPQYFHESPKENITFKFRVSKPLKDVDIFIKNQGIAIKKIYKNALIPSEMVLLDVEKEKLLNIKGSLEIEVKNR